MYFVCNYALKLIVCESKTTTMRARVVEPGAY